MNAVGFRDLEEGYDPSLGELGQHLIRDYHNRNTMWMYLYENPRIKIPGFELRVPCGDSVHHILVREGGRLKFLDHDYKHIMDELNMAYTASKGAHPIFVDQHGYIVDARLPLSGCAKFLAMWRQARGFNVESITDLARFENPEEEEWVKECITLIRSKNRGGRTLVNDKSYGDVLELRSDARASIITIQRNAARRLVRKAVQILGWNIRVVSVRILSDPNTTAIPIHTEIRDNIMHLEVRESIFDIYREHGTLACINEVEQREGIAIGYNNCKYNPKPLILWHWSEYADAPWISSRVYPEYVRFLERREWYPR